MDGPGRLKRLRELLKLTQRELAKEMKVTHGAIALWERGERPIAGPVLRLIQFYEEEIGLLSYDERISDEFDHILSSQIQRQAKIGKLMTNAFWDWIGLTLRSIFRSRKNKTIVYQKVFLSMANAIVKELGQMKGLPMKLGQIFSFLDFAMPEEARAAFEKLQTSSSPLSYSKLVQILKEDLKIDPKDIFAQLSRRPIASASIGQVHLAKLKNREIVAVKVQYPEIAEAIRADLKNLSCMNPFIKYLFLEKEKGALITELSDRFLEECDYQKEIQNQEHFRTLFENHPQIVIPRVLKDLSGRRVICSEYWAGQSFQEFSKNASQEEKNRAGEVIWQFAFESIFRHGIFNADPHPGNYLFEGGKIIFLDFGCVRKFSLKFISGWKSIIRSVLESNDEKVIDGLFDVGMIKTLTGLDRAHMMRLIRSVYEPCLVDSQYSFAKDYSQKTFHLWFRDNPNREKMFLAQEWIFLMRLTWGVGSILSKLEARSNWRQKLIPLVYDEGSSSVPEPIPLPRSTD